MTAADVPLSASSKLKEQTNMPRCPECGSLMQIDEHAETETLVWRKATGTVERVREPAIVAFCTGCEFSIDLQRAMTQMGIFIDAIAARRRA